MREGGVWSAGQTPASLIQPCWQLQEGPSEVLASGVLATVGLGNEGSRRVPPNLKPKLPGFGSR